MSDTINVVLRLLKLLVMLGFIAHWMACIFYLVGVEGADQEKSWIIISEIWDQPVYDQYIHSLYWAVTTMLTVGYGDTVANASGEKICCVVCMLISCVMFAYIVGSIGSLVRNASQVADRLREQMINMDRFLARRRIPKELRLKIKRYLQYVIDEKTQVPIDEETLLNQLSIPLRDELTVYFRGQVLLSCPIFDDFSIDFMSYLTFFMNVESFSAGDTLFEEGNYFGEIGFFGHKPRTASADSLSFTQVLTLSVEGLQKVSSHFPESKRKLREIERLLDFGELSCLKISCYYCKQPGHIAAICSKAHEYIPSNNATYKYELKIIRKKMKTNRILDYYHQTDVRSNKPDTSSIKSGDEEDFFSTRKRTIKEQIEDARTKKGKALWEAYMEQQRLMKIIPEEPQRIETEGMGDEVFSPERKPRSKQNFASDRKEIKRKNGDVLISQFAREASEDVSSEPMG